MNQLGNKVVQYTVGGWMFFMFPRVNKGYRVWVKPAPQGDIFSLIMTEDHMSQEDCFNEILRFLGTLKGELI